MTAPYTPQHNRIVERKNMTLLDMVNAMLLNANLSNNLWGETLFTACHIHNRVSFKQLMFLLIKHEIVENQIWIILKCDGV